MCQKTPGVNVTDIVNLNYQKLSLNRANAVVKYFVSKGIKAIRLTGVGFGDTKPIADNNTEQGKNNNRRTEINVISN